MLEITKKEDSVVYGNGGQFQFVVTKGEGADVHVQMEDDYFFLTDIDDMIEILQAIKRDHKQPKRIIGRKVV